MKTSEKGRKLLAQWEGFRLRAYNDSVGKPTIGVGHLLTPHERSAGSIIINGKAVHYGNGLTEEQVLDLLSQDLERFEDAVNDSVSVDLQQNQFDALVSFTFNLGENTLKNSTLLKLLNEGEYDAVPAEMKKFVKAGGKVVQGLVNRRNNEINLWNAEI